MANFERLSVCVLSVLRTLRFHPFPFSRKHLGQYRKEEGDEGPVLVYCFDRSHLA